MKIVFHNIVFVLIAIFLSSVGVNLIVDANIGSDPLTIFQQGVSTFVGVKLAEGIFIVNLALIIISLLINYKSFGWATVAHPLTIGFAVSVTSELIKSLELNQQTFIIKLIIMIVAQLCFSMSYAILIEIDRGAHSMDIIVIGLSDKLKIRYIYIRYIFDFFLGIVGWTFGGVIGLGTLISLLIQGPTIVLSRRIIKYL